MRDWYREPDGVTTLAPGRRAELGGEQPHRVKADGGGGGHRIRVVRNQSQAPGSSPGCATQ
jgi:hypothetical protein